MGKCRKSSRQYAKKEKHNKSNLINGSKYFAFACDFNISFPNCEFCVYDICMRDNGHFVENRETETSIEIERVQYLFICTINLNNKSFDLNTTMQHRLNALKIGHLIRFNRIPVQNQRWRLHSCKHPCKGYYEIINILFCVCIFLEAFNALMGICCLFV